MIGFPTRCPTLRGDLGTLAVVPAVVLVHADHIDQLAERVLDMGLDALSWQREERAGDEAGRVDERTRSIREPMNAVRSSPGNVSLATDHSTTDGRQRSRNTSSLVCSSVLVSVASLDHSIPRRREVRPKRAPLVCRPLRPSPHRVDSAPNERSWRRVPRPSRTMWRRPRPRGPRAAGRAFGMHRDAFQENHLAIDDDVASSRLDGAEADRVGHAIGARLEDDLVQPRGTRVPALVFGNVRCRHGEALVGRDLRDHPSSAISRRAEVGTSPSTLTSPTSELVGGHGEPRWR